MQPAYVRRDPHDPQYDPRAEAELDIAELEREHFLALSHLLNAVLGMLIGSLLLPSVLRPSISSCTREPRSRKR